MASSTRSENIDEGYAWVIMLASFLAHLIQYGIVWTVGVLYPVFLRELPDATYTSTAAVGSLNTATFYFTGPVARVLYDMYGARLMTMIGGCLGCLGLCLSMYTTSIYHLQWTFGILTGFGFGLAYIPSISIVCLYFERRRTIALGLAVSGCGMGTIVFPQLIQYLLDEYGWRRGLLIIGAVCMNMLVCGALMRPIHSSLNRNKNRNKYERDVEVDTATNSVTRIENGVGVNKELKEISNNKTLINGNSPEYNLKEVEEQQQTKNLLAKEGQNEVETKTPLSWIQKCAFLNCHVLMNKSYVVLCLNNLFFCFGLSIIYVHLGAYGMSIGFTGRQGAMLFTVLGIANFVGRIVFGLCAHAPWVSGVGLYTVAFFATGAVTALVTLFRTYVALLTFAVLFGFLTASLGTLLPVILADILGDEMRDSGYGYLLVFEGVGTLIGAPVAAAVYDATKVYQTSLYLGASTIIMSSLLMSYPWFCASKLPGKHTAPEDLIIRVSSEEVEDNEHKDL